MAARRDVAIDPYHRPVAADPDEVEREAHRERVHRAAAQPQRAILGQLVEPPEPAPPRARPARLVHTQPAAQLAPRQAPAPALPRAHPRRTASPRRRSTNSPTGTLPSSPLPWRRTATAPSSASRSPT